MSKKVRLTKLTTVRGNPYHAGVYEEGYLPEAILQTPGLVVEPEATAKSPEYQNALKKQSVSIGAANPSSQRSSFKAEKPVEIPEDKVAGSVEKPPGVKININQATADQISDLDGITVAIAGKVIEAREKAPFTGLEDLKQKVPLKGSKDWGKLALSFD